MNQIDWLERTRKRELRTLDRNIRLERERQRRGLIRKNAEEEALIIKKAAEAIREDNKKPGKSDKKPGPGKFLALYSYIPSNVFDTRNSVPPAWKPHSFNEKKQQDEFLKKFVYPYPLPEILLNAASLPEYRLEKSGHRIKTPDSELIQLSKKWIGDIVSGESFCKRNKDCFTKAEAHFFLNSKMAYADSGSVLKLFFYAKSRGRSMGHKLSMMAAVVFSEKFYSQFRNNLVESFLDLLGRTPERRFDFGMLGDLCDFVLEKIQDNKKNHGRKADFSFSGRTIDSVMALANEWHERLRRETEARQAQQETHQDGQQTGKKKRIDTSKWNGLGLARFWHETDESVWSVTELTTAQDLLNEGRKMKNCVASYALKCADGISAIFSVERFYLENQVAEKIATLEVNQAKRGLIQAKGKCNTALTSKVKSVITRWAQANGIAVRLTV